MAKEITKMIIIYEKAYKDIRKKLIKTLKSHVINFDNLISLKGDFAHFVEIYNNLLYFNANSFEVK